MQELTLKELRFIELYTDPENKETFGNKTESYMQAFDFKGRRETASVEAYRLVRLPQVNFRMEEIMSKNEIEMMGHWKTLDRKLKKLAEEGKITREELMGLRLLAEVKGEIGSGTKIGIGIKVGDKQCEGCPYNKPLFSSDMIKDLPPIDITDLPPLPDTKQGNGCLPIEIDGSASTESGA